MAEQQDDRQDQPESTPGADGGGSVQPGMRTDGDTILPGAAPAEGQPAQQVRAEEEPPNNTPSKVEPGVQDPAEPGLETGISGSGPGSSDGQSPWNSPPVRIGGVLVVIAIIAVLVIAFLSNGGSGGSKLGEMVPDDAEVLAIIDVEQLAGDRVFNDVLDELDDDYGRALDDMGIDFDSVSELGIVTTSDFDRVFMVSGGFDREEIEEELDDMDYRDDLYRDVPIWEGDRNWSIVGILNDETLVLTYDEDIVKDFIRTSEEPAQSLWRDETISSVRKRLPDAFIRTLILDCEDDDLDGCESSAISVGKSDSSTFGVTWTSKFNSERRAERAMDVIEDEMRDEDAFFAIDVVQNGEYVTATSEIDIDDFIDIGMLP